MIPLDYYVVSWHRGKHEPVFNSETVANMLERNRGVFAAQNPSDYIVLSFERTRSAADAAIEEFHNILKLAKEERTAIMQNWPTEPFERPLCPQCGKAMYKTTWNGRNDWKCVCGNAVASQQQ